MPDIKLWQVASIDDVAAVPELVAKGKRTALEIANSFGRVQRQGTYLAEAAAILGLIARPRGGFTVTPYGAALSRLRGPRRRALLRRLVASTNAGDLVLRELRKSALSEDQLVARISRAVKPRLARSTLTWRVLALLQTMQKLGLVSSRAQRYKVTRPGSKIGILLARGRVGSIKHSPGRVVDVELRTRIERVAVSHVSKHYTRLGFDVTTRERENLGWDLEVCDPLGKVLWLVEVKGTSRSEFVVELTHNEYAQMRKKRRSYRVCVVTTALRKPHVHEFAYDSRARRWMDEKRRSLEIRELVAARLSSRPVRETP